MADSKVIQSFKDNEGRNWIVDVNVASVEWVRKELELDLLDVADGKVFEKLLDDPVLLVNVIYVLIRRQAKEKGVSDEEFGLSMGGDCLDFATTAMLNSLLDFFRPSKRRVLKMALARLTNLQERALTMVGNHLESPEIDKMVDSALGSLSSSLRESLESIPDRLPSES